MPKKLPSEIEAHLHDTVTLTLEKIDRFADADRLTQLEVIAILRHRASLQSETFELAIYAIAVACLGLVVAPSTSNLIGSDAISNAVSAVVLGFLVIVGLLPLLITHYSARNRAEKASTWLAAYDSELSRRRTMPGIGARRWRKTH